MTDAARAIADVSSGLVLATVDIKAPIERVFKALTDPAELPQWWGSSDMYQTTAMTADFREGGAWRTQGRSADGSTFSVGGVYSVVEPPHRLDMTWKPDWESFESLVSYNLQTIEGGTRVTVRHSGFGEHAASCGNHAFGWERVLGWLDAFIAPRQDSRMPFVVRLIPPRPTFATDATPDELAVMQSHAVYWRGLMAQGAAVAFGPVNDPSGHYGLGIFRVVDEAELKTLMAADPAITGNIGMRQDIAPMFNLVTA